MLWSISSDTKDCNDYREQSPLLHLEVRAGMVLGLWRTLVVMENFLFQHYEAGTIH